MLILIAALFTLAVPVAAQTRADLGRLSAQLQALTAQRAALEPRTAALMSQLGALEFLADGLQDPADSLYREARSSLNRGNYTKAAFLFARIHEEYPRSSYAADAYYWQATALYRNGTTENLQAARAALATQRSRHPDTRTRSDAADLLARVNGELAKRGDQQAIAALNDQAREIASPPNPPNRAERPARPTRSQGRARCGSDDDDEKSAALNALLQMDADRALPLLERVMSRTDAASACLRRKATFMISQHQGPEAEAMLLRAARNDPDQEVREQAVFWLGQAGGERAAVALDSILRRSQDRAIQDKAIFALSQNQSERAQTSLRDFAMRSDAPTELRGNAIFWLGQSGRSDATRFLLSAYQSLDERALKEKVIFSVAQNGGAEAGRWLAEIAGNRAEAIELRKNAIFWMSQSRSGSLPELFSLYDRLAEREIREQLIFAYSQRNERAATDKLIEIAKADPDREMRKKAIFWLSQSKDPRVPAIIEEILNKP